MNAIKATDNIKKCDKKSKKTRKKIRKYYIFTIKRRKKRWWTYEFYYTCWEFVRWGAFYTSKSSRSSDGDYIEYESDEDMLSKTHFLTDYLKKNKTISYKN